MINLVTALKNLEILIFCDAMKSSRSGSSKNRSLSNQMMTLHQRLQQALTLGINKSEGNKGRRWQCTDVEVQVHAVRSMTAFVGCVSSDLLHHPLVKNSISDMLLALEGILQSGNEVVLSTATNVTVKLLDLLGNSILQYPVSELAGPLSSLLSSHQSTIAISSAIALNNILSKMTPWRLGRHQEIWEVIKETNAIGTIIGALQNYVSGSQPVERFIEMASLLRTILWQWPLSRYPVWSNAKLMAGLETLCKNFDSSISYSILQLYSALALCGNGALKLLDSGTVLSMMLHSMQNSQPRHVQLEAFILSQYLFRYEEGWSRMTDLSCKPIVECIINGMNVWRQHFSGKIPVDQVPLVVEACRSALITRWAGEHHSYFWKLGIDQVLLNILLNNSSNFNKSLAQASVQELRVAADKILHDNGLSIVRPYIWDILGWIAAHCPPNFNPKVHQDGFCLNVLIACACSVAVDSIHEGDQCSGKNNPFASEREPVTRSALQMVYSPCNYITSQARHFLSEALMPKGEKYLESLLASVKLSATKEDFIVGDYSHIVVKLIGLMYYLSLIQYQSLFTKSQLIKTLASYIRKCLSSDVHVRRSSIAPHLQNPSNARTCCWVHTEDWEGDDLLLFFSLWALSEYMGTDFADNNQQMFSGWVSLGKELENLEAQNLVDMLQKLSADGSSPGVRWYSACSLSFFGFYGFHSGLGQRIKKALNDNELADLQLELSSGQHVGVHSVILTVRCPSLLPSKVSVDGSAEERSIGNTNFRPKVRLSARVGNDALVKLLEFVYGGFIQADNGLVKKLKVLSKCCNLKTLSDILYRKRPKWGTAIPSLDFTPLRTDAYLSDTILEAISAEVMPWNCSLCFISMPHIHVHKIVLWSSCDYLQALFQSGMQDSYSQTIKVPVGWNALSKLVSWFYTGKLPKPNLDCVWNNLNMEQQLHELQAYLEISWLSEFWFLGDVQEESLTVVLSCLKLNTQLSLLIIQSAANLTQWKIVDTAANYLAPVYPQMRESGDLEVIDEKLRDMVRATYVRLSQEAHHWHD